MPKGPVESPRDVDKPDEWLRSIATGAFGRMGEKYLRCVDRFGARLKQLKEQVAQQQDVLDGDRARLAAAKGHADAFDAAHATRAKELNEYSAAR